MAATNGTALARIADATGFNRAQVELVKDTIAKGASDDELMLFLHMAQRTGLDPFSKQIYLIKRWDNKEKREVMSAQTGIDGLRLIADRTERYAPGRAPTFEYDNGGALFSATAYVKKFVRGEWHEVAATAHYDEYVQRKRDGGVTQMWEEKPHIMLAKCAEALALRRAFPADLSSLYTADEMRDTEPVVVNAAPAVAAPVKRAALPLAPAADTATGEVIDAAPEHEEAPAFTGPVQAEPKAKYDNAGNLHMNFKVDGVNFLYRNAPPEIAYLEKGDTVTITHHPEQISGKAYNIVDSLTGQKNADGMTDWEERATAAAADGAEFEPVEGDAPVEMLAGDLPPHL